MRTWQGTWNCGGFFLLWAEVSRRNREANQPEFVESQSKILEHPFCCSGEELLSAIAELGFDFSEFSSAILYLPSDENTPHLSPRASINQSQTNASPSDLRPWSIPTLRLTPLEAASVLTTIPREPTTEFRFDHSLTYWQDVTCFVLELMTRGRFLPSLSRMGQQSVASWQPVIVDERDIRRLDLLSRTIPPICLALEDNNISPAALADSFITSVIGALAKSFIRSQPLSEAVLDEDLIKKYPAAYEWLKGLSQGDGALTKPGIDYTTLERRLRGWAGKFFGTTKKHALQTVLRVIAPEPTEHSDETQPRFWQLEFLVRSVDDPSHTLSAADIWQGNFGFLRDTDHSREEVEEQLLLELGKISDHVPAIRTALQQRFPTTAKLSTREAYQFLREASRLTELSGVGIIYPDWWEKVTAAVGLKLRVNAPELSSSHQAAKNLIGKSDLLTFDWEVALGDQTIPVEKFKDLVANQAPLVEINGKWVELPPEKVAATIAFLEKQKSRQMLAPLEALRLGLAVETNPEIFPVVEFSASGWISQLLDSERTTLPVVSQPENFVGQLRPYQLEGISWLNFLAQSGVGGCLADDMGLGKTIQLLALMVHERNKATRPPDPTLLVVPMSILDNWDRETKKFTPSLRVYQHHGPSRLLGNGFQKAVSESDLVITTYSLIYRDEQLFQQVRWGRIALDEAQNIKNLNTKQTQSLRALCRNQLADTSREVECRRIVLTGTPLENHLEELWSVFDFLNPGILGTVAEFRSRFAVPIERDRDKDTAAVLSKVIRPFILRRLKTDARVISDLPEKIEMEERSTLTPEQAALYQQTLNSMLGQIDKSAGIHRKGLVLATITKLKQICNHPSLLLQDSAELGERSAKLNRLVELLEVIISEGDKVLIFTQYAQMGHLLKPFLEERFNREVLFLHGSLSRGARDEIVTKFQRPDGPSLFVLSLKAGGFGLNLTEANQVIHYDQWWNPAVHDQATDRAYRIGQKRNVQVRKFICKGTLEERIHEMLLSKKDLADKIVGATKNLITEMSTDELKSLLTLSAEYLSR